MLNKYLISSTYTFMNVLLLSTCGRCEGDQGVLTLVFGEVVQAFHDDRIVELNGQTEEEEQEGIRTEDDHNTQMTMIMGMRRNGRLKTLERQCVCEMM